MDLSKYNEPQKKPLSFEEWKGNLAPSYSDESMKSLERLHGIKYKEEFDKILQAEYQEYCDNINGNWLLK